MASASHPDAVTQIRARQQNANGCSHPASSVTDVGDSLDGGQPLRVQKSADVESQYLDFSID